MKSGLIIPDGTRFSRLIVLSFVGLDKFSHQQYWCVCDCGNKMQTSRGSLLRTLTRSCGCLRKEQLSQRQTRHGASKHKNTHKYRMWTIWKGLTKRCNNPKSASYRSYGQKGIQNEWVTFDSFLSDMEKDYLHHVKIHGVINTTLDRVDNNRNYCKNNCRWATRKLQVVNRKVTKLVSYNQKLFTLEDLSLKTGVNIPTLYYRIYIANWPLDKALNKQICHKKKTQIH